MSIKIKSLFSRKDQEFERVIKKKYLQFIEF
jgi:hypothetical protein